MGNSNARLTTRRQKGNGLGVDGDDDGASLWKIINFDLLEPFRTEFRESIYSDGKVAPKNGGHQLSDQNA